MYSLINNDISNWITQVMQTAHAKDFHEFVGQVGYTGLQKLRQSNLFHDASPDTSDEQSFLIRTGQAKIFSLEGNHLAMKIILENLIQELTALIGQSASSSMQKIAAYVFYEHGLFHYKVKEYQPAKNQFRMAYRLNPADRFRLMVQYQLDTIKLEGDRTSDLESFRNLIGLYKKHQMFIMYILGLHRLGIFYRMRKEYQKTETCYNEAMQLARKYEYHYLSALLQNAQGYLHLSKGKPDTAAKIFQETLKITESNYQRALMLENMALIHYQQKQYETAANYCFRALEISQKYYVLTQIPDECLFLGDVYLENLHDLSKSEFFYAQGYQAAMFQVSQGLTMAGARERAVTVYMEFLKTYFPSDEKADMPEQLFAFAIGRSWDEIISLYKYNLIVFSKLKHGPGKKLFKHLGIRSSNFYTMQSRLARKGFVFPDFRNSSVSFPDQNIIQSLQTYIKSQGSVTWHEGIQMFERDIMKFLFSRYGYQKKRLASALGISVPSVTKKTKSFIQIQENLPLQAHSPDKGS